MKGWEMSGEDREVTSPISSQDALGGVVSHVRMGGVMASGLEQFCRQFLSQGVLDRVGGHERLGGGEWSGII
jgi:hypothetical protein